MMTDAEHDRHMPSAPSDSQQADAMQEQPSSSPQDTPISPEGATAPRPNYVGLVFLSLMAVVGIVYVATSLSYGLTAETNPLGPGAAPAALGLLLVAGCLVLLGQEAVAYRKAKAAAKTGARTHDPVPPGARDLVKPVIILLILVVGLMLVPLVGMIIAMPISVMAIALFVEKTKPVPVVIMGAVTALMLWLLFDQLLSVRFPNSLIGL